MRRGRDADPYPFTFDDDVRAKLGTQYMDLPKDPWGKKYQFWPGPWDKNTSGVIPFRAWRNNKRSSAKIGETGYVLLQVRHRRVQRSSIGSSGQPAS